MPVLVFEFSLISQVCHCQERSLLAPRLLVHWVINLWGKKIPVNSRILELD
jgi:hypothetical protein